MQRLWLKAAAAALVVVALCAAVPARAADAPFVSGWKLLDVSSGNETALVLFQVEEKDGKYQAKVHASPLLGMTPATIENVKADAKSIQFDVKYSNVLHVKAYAPKADAKNKNYYGTILFNGRIIVAQLVKTDDKELTQQDARGATAEGTALAKARAIMDAKDQQKALNELIEKHSDKPVAYAAGQMLLQSYVKEAPEEKELKATAEQFIKSAANFGPEAEKNATVVIAQTLSRAEKVSPLAVEFARKAEKALTKEDNATHVATVLKTLQSALKKTGKADEAKELEPRLAKIEATLDVEFEKTAIPFKPDEFKGRKAGSKRVALVELFTGAYCPPCVAADIAFDAALQTYKPTDVILLQYHTHIPAPDRLTNLDTLSRLKFYGQDVRGVPTAFLNGKTTKPLGGGKANAQRSYDSLRSEIDEALETEATAAIKLNVERKGDKLDIGADVSELKKPGENVKLRIVLVEDVVRYPGGNGQRLHHHVVRAMPGGADGMALKEAKAKQTVAVNLADLKKSLEEYMADFPKTDARKRTFLDDENPLSLKHFKIVAFIQDDDSKEILQAVQIDVPEAK